MEQQPQYFGQAVDRELTRRDKAFRLFAKTALYAGAGLAGATVGVDQSPQYQGELAAGTISYTMDAQVDLAALGDSKVTIDTSVGQIAPAEKVAGLPLDVTIRPTIESTPSVDALRTSGDVLEQDIRQYGVQLAKHAGIGLLTAEALLYTASALRRQKPLSKRDIAMATAGAMLAGGSVAGYGAASFNRDLNISNYVATGMLGNTLQNWPTLLEDYYHEDSVLNAGLTAWGTLEQNSQDQSKQLEKQPETGGLKVMTISDLHLANTYGDIAEIAKQNQVDLVINTGDESEWGLAGEISPAYKQSIEQLTSQVPMIWIAGNHDSPQTVAAMRTIPGVIVLGDKQQNPDGSYKGRADQVSVYGLDILATTDPRILGMGDEGIYGKQGDGASQKKLAEASVANQLADVDSDKFYNIAMSHEPAAAVAMPRNIIKDQPGLDQTDVVQMTMSGHMHSQNKLSNVQPDDLPITLREGSAGGGGIRYEGMEGRQYTYSIIEFESDCQAANITRVVVSDEVNPLQEPTVVSQKLTFQPQPIPEGQVCDTKQGISDVTPVTLGYDQATTGALQKNGQPY